MNFNYDVITESLLYKIARPVFRFVLFFKCKLKYVGKENVPKDARLIIASNHVSAFDPAYIMIGVKRSAHFMSKAELFENKFVCKLITRLQGFPVHREKLDRKALGYAEKLLENEKVLGIFPEGTRSKTGKPIEAKNGVGMIAVDTNSDILPVCIYIDPNDTKKRKTVTVKIGKVIKIDEFNFDQEKTSVKVKTVTAKIMQDITEMWEAGV